MHFSYSLSLFATTALATSLITPSLILPPLNLSTPPLNLSDHSPAYLTSGTLVHSAAIDINAVWEKARCKGERLLYATYLSRTGPRLPSIITPVDSPWTQPFGTDLSTWGYSFDTDNGTPQWRQGKHDECESSRNHELERMFRDLGIDTRSTWQNGPNRCYSIYHKDGSAVKRPGGNLPPARDQRYDVNGREYKVTNAEFTIGVNAPSGLITFINRQSPKTSAKRLWNVANPPRNQLPRLGASSDIAWGLWSSANPGNLRGIKYSMSTPITNDDTEAIFKRIVTEYIDIEWDELEAWPGHSFFPDEAEYKALLGSPNALAVGYFLNQHKAQLGQKHVSQIQIFKSDSTAINAYCMLLSIADGPPPASGEIVAAVGEAKYASISLRAGVENWKEVEREGAKNVLREHVIYV